MVGWLRLPAYKFYKKQKKKAYDKNICLFYLNMFKVTFVMVDTLMNVPCHTEVISALRLFYPYKILRGSKD